MVLAARASLNGVDLSGPSTARNILGRKAPTGQMFYDEDMARMLVKDARGRGLFGVDGALVNDPVAASIMYSDHFKGAAINAAYDVTAGSNGSVVAFATDTTVKSGAVKGTTGAAGDTAAHDAIALSLNNPIQLSATSVVELSASLLLSAYTSVYFFLGFTDTLPASVLEYPITLSVVTFTTTATDAVGFMYDTAATTKTIRLTGVKADTDATMVDTGIAPSGSAFLDMHIRLEGNTAYFSIDGQTFSGGNSVANAASLATNLYPIIVVGARTTSARNASVDFLRGAKLAA